jgi:alkanesulfonate monooxygenase SsuD/methylene tetrahydromethanopterin reductase-like flavin-dependent oxidoreductase (luciferase family)
VDECNISGTPDEVIGRIEEFRKTGVRHFISVIGNPEEEYDDAMKLFASEVVPHFSS